MSNEKVSDEDMYEFLKNNNYIQTGIITNIYDSPVKLTLNIKHFIYKSMYFYNSFCKLFSNFPFSYLKDLNKEKKLDIKKIEEQSQNTSLNLKDLEIKKLVFIFCIVFFPLNNSMNPLEKKTRLKLKYYPDKIVNIGKLNRDTNYIDLYKQHVFNNGKKYEFIDVYIDWVECDNLKNFACYTYLHFLLNMVEGDIEFYQNYMIGKYSHYYKKIVIIEEELNGIKDKIKSIINSNKEKKFYTDGPTYSALYEQTDKEFFKFLNSEDLLNKRVKHYKSGYKIVNYIKGGKKSKKRKHKKQKRKSTRKKRRKSNKKHR